MALTHLQRVAPGLAVRSSRRSGSRTGRGHEGRRPTATRITCHNAAATAPQPACIGFRSSGRWSTALTTERSRLHVPRGAINQNEPPVEQPQERTVSEMRIYSWEQWEEHRNSNRYFRHLAAMPTSRIVRALLPHVIWVMAVATGVGLYALQSDLQDYIPPLPLIYRPFEMTSFALALLLVFRTDASYARFQNARSSWRVIISQTREINRLASCYFDQGDRALESMNRWVAALGWCIRDHLLPESELEWRLTGVLTPAEMEALKSAKVYNKPAFVFVVLTQLINRREMDGDKEMRGQMLDCLGRLEETLAECERLLKTPIPLSYTRHTSRFLITYLTFLPFALWDECQWGLVPISGVVAFLLLGIDEIGVQIEEPFSILPLDRFCQTIHQDALSSPSFASLAETLILGELEGDVHRNGVETDKSSVVLGDLNNR